MADRVMPTARAGNYAAPLDTTGVDPEMQKTLGTTVDKNAAPDNPIMAGLKKMFGGGAPVKTAAQKSASVKRTSDLPRLSDAEENKRFSDFQKSKLGDSRTSDKPVIKKGQGIQGQGRRNSAQPGAY
jgi:hypothetical protein